MSRQMTALAVLGALLMSACANGPPEKTPPVVATSGGTSLGELPAQQLTKGQCALVLWSHKSLPLRFLVTLDQPAVARVQVEGKMIELVRVAQSGQPLYGQFPEQHYRGDGHSLGVSFAVDAAKGLNGGAVVSSALVEYVDAKGWTAIIPAAGLIACQT